MFLNIFHPRAGYLKIDKLVVTLHTPKKKMIFKQNIV